MIRLGFESDTKLATIAQYRHDHDIVRVVVISGQVPLPIDGDHVPFKEVIKYKTFYRLLQEIDQRTLVVLDECLRMQNRYSLEYNCIRNILNQTPHVLVFQWLPFIESVEDFMVLFDFATRSRWKREAYTDDLVRRADVVLYPRHPLFRRVEVSTSEHTRQQYQKTRQKLFDEIGNRDPHTIPRNLQLVATVDKKQMIDPARWYVARNQRFKLANVVPYHAVTRDDHHYTVLDLPHRFIDFTDFLFATGQQATDVLVADLKVEHWYWQRYQAWQERLNAFVSVVSTENQRPGTRPA